MNASPEAILAPEEWWQGRTPLQCKFTEEISIVQLGCRYCTLRMRRFARLTFLKCRFPSRAFIARQLLEEWSFGFCTGFRPAPMKTYMFMCINTCIWYIYIYTYIYIDVHTDKTYTVIPISLFLAGGLSNEIPKWGQLETYSLGLESVNDQWLILRAIPTYCKVVPPSKAHALPVFVPTQRGERRYIYISIYIYAREKEYIFFTDRYLFVY
jgi:hypothetical protein